LAECVGLTMRRRGFLAGSASLLAAIPFAGHAASELTIVATTGMIADAARQIGGKAASVKALMGPGVDPHAYRQTRSDIVAMSRADLVLQHGLYLEAQMEDFLYRLTARTRVVAVAESMPRDVLIAHDEYEDKQDPHLWMDPRIWSEVVIFVRDAMMDASEENASAFEENAAAYLAGISNLATYADRVIATVPKDRRVLLTAHDAFNYFGRAYEFDVVGIQGISTESEAGLRRIEELVDLLVERDVGAVFVESSVSDRNIRALIEGAAAKGHEVRIGGELFSDAMGPDKSYEGTYIGMMDHNVTTIAAALGGEVPDGGMQGLLN